jgi:hypothetical protein
MGSGPIPEGDYTVEITKVEEKFSSKGNPMVAMTCQVKDPTNVGANIFHNVTFLQAGSPGAGIAIHFLKCIDEPHEELESLDVEPQRWVGKQFKAHVIQDTYKKQDGSTTVNNKIKGVEASEIPF